MQKKRLGMPIRELPVELWNTGITMKTFTLDANGLELLGTE